jgi:hypothetical protein
MSSIDGSAGYAPIGVTMTGNIPARAPYQGLVQIFNYNRPFYLRTLCGAMASIILSLWLPLALRTLLLIATGAAIFWACSSLLVSHYIDDRPGFSNLHRTARRYGWSGGDRCGRVRFPSQAPIIDS